MAKRNKNRGANGSQSRPVQADSGTGGTLPSAPNQQASSSQNNDGKRKAQAKNQKRQAKRKSQQEAATMATPKNTNRKRAVGGILPYGPRESRERLDAVGFHPSVTSLTPEDICVTFVHRVVKCGNRPTRAQYVSSKSEEGFKGFNQGHYTFSKSLVDMVLDESAIPEERSAPTGLDVFIANDHAWNRFMAVELAGDGFKTLRQLSIASPKAWRELAQEVAIFDCNVNLFRGTENGKVFLAVSPEYTIGDAAKHLMAYREGKDCGPDASWVMRDWHQDTTIGSQIEGVLEGAGAASPYWGKGATYIEHEGFIRGSLFFTRDVIRNIRCLRNLDKQVHRRQVNATPWHHPYYFGITRSVEGLETLLKAIMKRKEVTEVIHFQKTQLLDRRLLAVILRACPNVRMLGVYDCPLIHFGDVITILDLIHEVNQDRRRRGLPVIDSFDFYPCYYYGTPYKGSRAATFGLTWGPRNKEVVQRGQFRVLLEAYLKSRAMGVKLLFDEGHAFRFYLARIPGHPLAIPCFLDGMARYLDLVKSGNAKLNDLKQAMYDTLKPVRMGLESLDEDWSSPYYQRRMGQLYFCCSCGYQVPEEMFTAGSRDALPHMRICSGCILRMYLDEEDDHNKGNKREIVDYLFPKWDGKQFNMDAPLDKHSTAFMRLKSTQTVRPSAPIPVVQPNGSIITPPYQEPLIRDGKIHYDSVQGLPDLETLLSLKDSLTQWVTAPWEAHSKDAERMIIHHLRLDYPEDEGDVRSFASTRPDGAVIDHFDELQPPYRQNPRASFPCGPSDDFLQAYKIFCWFQQKKY